MKWVNAHMASSRGTPCLLACLHCPPTSLPCLQHTQKAEVLVHKTIAHHFWADAEGVTRSGKRHGCNRTTWQFACSASRTLGSSGRRNTRRYEGVDDHPFLQPTGG